MNSQYPVPNSAISFNPSNPNCNFQNPQLNLCVPSSSSQFPFQNPNSDIPNSLISLKNLIQSSNSTVECLSSIIPPLSLSSKSLIQCPSNPNHWVPQNSLFLHSLNCPSSIDDVGNLLDSLHYPKTLKSEQHLIQFVQPLDHPTSELCFSLDDYVDFGSNFFYQDCPGVVGSLNYDASRRIFTLPGVLSVECANLVGSDRDNCGILGSDVKMLPSEIWAVRREFEQWSEFPNELSYSVLRAFLCMEFLKESELLTWLIVNSPRFGVVIDAAMSDHMSVLVRLCLKAMTREAAHCHGSLFKSYVGDNNCEIDPKALRLKCPVTVEVLRWLASQLSILYGEANAKSFVIALLGHLLLTTASHASVFPLNKKMEHISAIEQERYIFMGQSSKADTENEEDGGTNKNIFSRSIFVYEIAAAVAALHERSLLEGNIRTLRNPHPLTAYQRMAEHQYISKKADEERQKRRDYRSLVEHDSLPSQRQHDQQNMKIKTREELLAEERDYKRRRMSYRGKKQRTAKEVMRDIIEDYMEAIKETGGIGGLAKEDAEGAKSVLKNLPAHNLTTHPSTHDQQHGHRKSLEYDNESRHTKPIDASPHRKDKHKKESYNHRHLDNERANKDRSSREYYSRSPSVDRRSSRPREHRSHRRSYDVKDMDEDERSYSVSNMSRYNDQKPLYSTSCTLRSSSGITGKRNVGSPDRLRWKNHENDGWGSFRRDEFDDRYDPSEASVNDDQCIGSESTRPES